MPWLAAVVGAAGSIAGGALSAKGASKVKYPEPKTVDPVATQQQWLNAQQQFLPQEYAYLNQVGALSDQQTRQRLYEASPWAQGYQKTAADTYGRYLEGGLTDAETSLIRKYAAEKAAQLGAGGSDFQRSTQLGSLLGTLSQRQQAATFAYPSFQQSMTTQMQGQVPSLSSITPTYAQFLNAMTGNTATQNEFAANQAVANAQPNPMLATVGTSIAGLSGMLTRYGLNKMSQQPTIPAENPYDIGDSFQNAWYSDLSGQ